MHHLRPLARRCSLQTPGLSIAATIPASRPSVPVASKTPTCTHQRQQSSRPQHQHLFELPRSPLAFRLASTSANKHELLTAEDLVDFPPMAFPERGHVCVIGGGVVGLTSALRILQHARQTGSALKVSVVAEGYGSSTTSAGAAGVWGPYKLSAPEALVYRRGHETHEHLMGLFHGPDAFHAGVSISHMHVLLEEDEPDPFWSPITYNFQRLSRQQLSHFPRKFKEGYFYTSVTCEGRYYLPWLTRQIQQLGGTCQQACLASLQDTIPGGPYDAVVNCCGLGAKELLQDKDAYPIRGQVSRVRAPWITQGYSGGGAYILPNRHSVVLGGTGQVGDWNKQVSLEDKARIWQECCDLLPSLKDAEHLEDWVGLRPGRTTLRLEADRLLIPSSTSAVIPVIHNYGHGGAGLTLAWGCAGDVVKLLAASLC